MTGTRPPVILNVCADEARRVAYRRALSEAGYHVTDAATGAAALEHALELPDVIVLDLQLPDVQGFEVCCRLRGHLATATIPVLHLSPTPVETACPGHPLEQGDDAYLTYAAGPAQLVATVETLLDGRQAERQFHNFIEAAPDAVVIIDRAGTMVRVNRQAEKMFDWSRRELIGKEVELLMPERLRARHREHRAAFMISPGTRPMGRALELWGLRRDGSEFPVEISLSPLGTRDGLLVSSIIRDITDRKQLERALREADRQKDEFLAMLAHELRNPIGTIRTALEVLKAVSPQMPQVDRVREVIDRQTNQMTRLVEDLLDISRVVYGKIRLKKESVELADVVAQSVEACRGLLDARHHEFTVALPDRPLRVRADSARLVQVWTNLLSNAAKYTEPGGQIALSAEVERGEVVVRLRDNGIGIARDVLPRVFELFAQCDTAVMRAHGGLGIGLALVSRLVAMHGGSVEAVSEGLGKGSEFVVRLPLLATEAT